MDTPFTLDFDTFWRWLIVHPNCIFRAGTPEVLVYDHEDFHWHFGNEGDSTLVVQVMRGKLLVGEFLIEPETVTYVQSVPAESDEEFRFDLIRESESDRSVVYFFVMTHGFEEEDPSLRPRLH